MSDEIVPPPARAPAAVPTGAVRQSRGAGGGARGEALGLTRKAVEAALARDILAMKLCLERVLPRCHERPVTFSLPSLAAVGNGEIDEPSPQHGTASTAREKVARGNLLQILTAGDDVEDEDKDIGGAEAIDDCDP
jgi:hypothetical protein